MGASGKSGRARVGGVGRAVTSCPFRLSSRANSRDRAKKPNSAGLKPVAISAKADRAACRSTRSTGRLACGSQQCGRNQTHNSGLRSPASASLKLA